MVTSRRRTRRLDPLASPEAVRRVLDRLQRDCPNILPKSERQVVKFLESVRHYERRPVINEGYGRPRRWPRESVAMVASKLKKLLNQETKGRVSVPSFISLYLPVLRYPTDVSNALSKGEINIREASYLAPLTSARLNCTPQQARQTRDEIIKAHLLTNGSQSGLRLRVKATLGELPTLETKPGKSGRQKVDDLLKRNPYDARHLFYEEILRLTEAMNDIEPKDLSEQTLGSFLKQTDKLLSMLRRVKVKRGHKAKAKLTI